MSTEAHKTPQKAHRGTKTLSLGTGVSKPQIVKQRADTSKPTIPMRAQWRGELTSFERMVRHKWENGRIKAPVHLCGGNEDELIELFAYVRPQDYVFTGHRNHYHAILKGVSQDAMYREMVGSKDGLCRGNGRSMGLIDHSKRFYASAIVGGMCAPAIGVAWSIKDKGLADTHVWNFIGDGATDTGHFYEALRYAESHDLPITFVIEDNDRSTCTSKRERWGDGISTTYEAILQSPKVWYYRYIAKWPHVGTGKYVAF